MADRVHKPRLLGAYEQQRQDEWQERATHDVEFTCRRTGPPQGNNGIWSWHNARV
jgi:hypothetical protein